jgi:hypothetical protein
MDEISPFNDTDEQYDLLIESMLDDMAKRYVCLLPLHLLRLPVEHLRMSEWKYGTGIYQDMVYAMVPVKFLRFRTATCPHWRRPVMEKDFFTMENPEYNRQFDIHTRAGIAKPKVFIGHLTNIWDMNKMFLVSPFRQNWLLSDLYFRYFYIPTISNTNSTLNLTYLYDEILDGFFYFTASAVLTSMKQFDFAKAMQEKFQEFLIKRQ